MFRVLVAMAALLLAVGCFKSEQTEQTAVTSKAVFHPIVAVVPVIDSARHDLDWDVSKELTDLLIDRLQQKGNFYLTSPQKVAAALKKVPADADPFSVDLSWLRQPFYDNEFVVFAELVEHEEVSRIENSLPLSEASMKDSSADLNISLRLRVVDMRRRNPEVILQEMLHVTHHIPRQFTRANFYQVSCDSDHFHISPLGLAHTDLLKTVATRLEDYIQYAVEKDY